MALEKAMSATLEAVEDSTSRLTMHLRSAFTVSTFYSGNTLRDDVERSLLHLGKATRPAYGPARSHWPI